jgi:hypothetical protein
MCRRTTCKACGRPNWAGCGAHVEQVLGDVPKNQRCQCRTKGAPPKAAKPAKTATTPVTEKSSWFSRLRSKS